MAKQKLIPAVAYLRKSTKGKTADGKERQEKSITQQRTEIQKLVAGRYQIIREYADEGVSGWKRNGKRPDFDRMLRDAKERGDFTAIICDDLDRFSRAEVMDVFADLSALSSAGVRTIHCVNQGEYGLGENDIGRIIKMVVDVHGGNDFSRKLSRRVSLAHRNRAKEGKRAGVAPYGLANDGKGGLKHGNRKHIAIVRRIFDEFVNRKLSLNSIASKLNAEGIPAPRGGKWFVQGIKELLKRPAYCGDFTYGRRQQGRFFTTAKDGEVVEVKEAKRQWKDDVPAFKKQNVYTPVVSRKVWNAAQERLASFSIKGSRRPRNDNPLAGILVCDHCGKPLYRCLPKGPKSRHVYRCGTPAKNGMSACGAFQISEDLILPQVLSLLSEEMDDLTKLLTNPPQDLVAPGRRRVSERESRQEERDALYRRIEQAENDWLSVDDSRIRQSLTLKISKLRDELEQMDAEIVTPQEPDYRHDELQRLGKWWDEFQARAVTVPVKKNVPDVVAAFWQDPFRDDCALLIDPRMVNDALQSLGTEVRLRWKSHRVTLRNGAQQNRYELVGGRFRLGQQTGKIAYRNGVRFHKAPIAERCSGTRGEDRCGSRKGRG